MTKKRTKNPILAIDYDGTITKENVYPEVGEIREECIEVLNRFKELGCILVLWTCRSDKALEDAIAYTKEKSLPIEYFNDNVDFMKAYGFTSRKIFAHEYIDDANIGGFIGWKAIEDYVLCKYFPNIYAERLQSNDE